MRRLLEFGELRFFALLNDLSLRSVSVGEVLAFWRLPTVK